jgi:NTE family protein
METMIQKTGTKILKGTLAAFLAAATAAPPALPADLQTQTAIPPQRQAEVHVGRPRVGLALGGGGTRGIAHIGVLQVLEKNGIPIDCIAGTSMGAIVGGLYSAGLTPDEIEHIFRSKSFVRSYDTIPIPLRAALIPIFILPHLCFHAYDGMYRGHKFANYIDKRVAADRRNIEDLRIPFTAVCSNLLDGKPASVTKGRLGTALQASSAIPGLRKPVIIGDSLLVDGGVVANLPVEQCRAMGADIVIAVDVDEQLLPLEKEHFRKIGSVPYRCLNMHLSSIDRPQLGTADIRIHPDVAGIELLSKDIKDMDLALKSGAKSAEEAIPLIKQTIDKKLANRSAEEGS